MKKPRLITMVIVMTGHNTRHNGDWTYHLTDGKTWLL